MAAAEYYNATAAAQSVPQYPSHHQSPRPSHYQSPRPPTHELYGSPIPQYSLPPPAPQGPPPPPYYPIPEQQKPAVHFASSSAPNSGPPSRPHSGRPSFSAQHKPTSAQYLQPPAHHSAYAQHGSQNQSSQALTQPPHMRPYMHQNYSSNSLSNGYSSDPEQRRRRRHKHHDRRDDEGTSRDVRPKKDRSRSTNTDSFIGAAGGGLIGDLIFPGLGTVGGAVAGWIGGRDYGKHRKHREEKRHQEQKDWEHEHRDRSGSHDRRHSDDRYIDHRRHNSAY